MKSKQTADRERRVNLALKWHYLDNCNVEEIQERFVEHGYGEFARSTIYDYLKEAPAEEVLEQIERDQAHTREQIADRQERLYKRAREAEFDSYERDEVVAMVPKFFRLDGEEPVSMRDWRVLDPEEYPPEATRFDKRIEFTDERKPVYPNEVAPVRGPDGEPVYEPKVVAVRKVEDGKERSFLRREQAEHLEAKGEVLGLYDDAEDRQADALEELAEGIDLTLSMEDKEALDSANDVEPDTML